MTVENRTNFDSSGVKMCFQIGGKNSQIPDAELVVCR